MRSHATYRVFLICSVIAIAAPNKAVSAGADAAANASKERPNIIIILSDDMGFSDIGAYGGEIKTPVLDNLAENGKKFTQFYNTARCCPTRASILTGLYPHQAGVGHLIFNTGHLGYGDHLTSDSVTLAEALQAAGYGTYMTGKWHLAPRGYDPERDTEYWPTSRGFDKFYGTIAGSGSFYDPSTLCRGTTYITPENDPEYKPENFYYTDALSDNAIKYLSDHDAKSDEKPFFLYLAYTAAHWPLHAPEDAIAEYRDKYDQGYEPVHAARVKRLDEMGLLPEVGEIAPPVGDWDKVDNKEVETSLMETYAAMVTRMDKGIGRIVEQLRASGELDNTLIVYLQDNGGCAEDPFGEPRDNKPAKPLGPNELQLWAQPKNTRDGRPVRYGHDVKAGPADTFTAYKENWANVSNAPFRMYKHYVHEGGISTPLIAHWPAKINVTSETQIVREPAHLIDIMPTMLEVAGAKQPAQRKGMDVQPLEGVSLAPLLTDSGDINRSEPIFFEHEGNRAVRDGKWKIVAISEKGEWELYDISVDRGEMNNLAAQQPERVKKMAAQWDAWAARARVLPFGGWRDRAKKDEAAATATKVVLKQGEILSREKSLALDDKGVSITASILSGPVEGVIVAQGASFDGFSLYAEGDAITFVTRHDKEMGTLRQAGIPRTPFVISAVLSPDGKATLAFGEVVAKAEFPGPLKSTPTQGIAAGLDSDSPVGEYPKDFLFKGLLGMVTVQTLEK